MSRAQRFADKLYPDVCICEMGKRVKQSFVRRMGRRRTFESMWAATTARERGYAKNGVELPVPPDRWRCFCSTGNCWAGAPSAATDKATERVLRKIWKEV